MLCCIYVLFIYFLGCLQRLPTEITLSCHGYFRIFRAENLNIQFRTSFFLHKTLISQVILASFRNFLIVLDADRHYLTRFTCSNFVKRLFHCFLGFFGVFFHKKDKFLHKKRCPYNRASSTRKLRFCSLKWLQPYGNCNSKFLRIFNIRRV